MFLVILRYKKPLAVVDEHLSGHRAFVDECYRNEILITSGPLIPRIGGVLISLLKDRAQVEAILKQDPFYIHQVADYEVLEFNPTRHHSDFERFIDHF